MNNIILEFKQKRKSILKAQFGTGILRKGWNWFKNASLVAAIAENPAVMTAAGWTIDSKTGKAKQDKFNTPERNKLADNLAVIGEAAITAPTLSSDIGTITTAIRHPVQTVKAINKGITNATKYVKNTNKINKELRKGIKENSVLESYNKVPENKDIGTVFDYQDFLDNIFPNSKLNLVFYHGGPKGILRFKSAKELNKTNKGINSGTKDYGIYLADDKSLGKFYLSSNKKGELYNLKVNVENPIEYNTNNWYLDRFSGNEDLRFRPGSITLKWYDRLGLKNYDAIYHKHSAHSLENGELVVFDPNNIHIMGTPKETQMFRVWKLHPTYSSKPLQNKIPIMLPLYDKTLRNYYNAAKPGIFLGSIAATPPGILIYQHYKNKK